MDDRIAKLGNLEKDVQNNKATVARLESKVGNNSKTISDIENDRLRKYKR